MTATCRKGQHCGGDGQVYRNRNLSRANNKLDLLCPSLCLFGVSFFRVLAKKANSKRLFARHLVLIFGRVGERVGRGGGSLWVGTLSGAGRLIVGSKSYSAHSRERENGFS